ncbi:MAG TPA: ABC-F family ATP-binding cassette domain-containing protein, partial [Tepidisphaeraceae bacterium]|nr:ABC-F family ATP-binding cassette domain-containing protein [Tepidisphaeraceae bacterium]
SLNNIEKVFGQRVLFKDLSFLIDRGERVGLIGENGAGKTTLFKLLTGEVTPDVGSASVAKTVTIGYLQQDTKFDSANSVMDEAELAFAQLHELSHRLRDLEHDMAVHTDEQLDKTLKQYEKVQHDFEAAGGYAWRHRLEATLLGVGLTESSWEQNVDTLSGGQRSRLALAKMLISEPDLLLLDEPTNHLDLTAIEWLENYLLEFKGAVLLISHDRYLLDRLATRIVWLTRQQLSNYPGNYSSFVQQKEIQELSQARAFKEQQEDIAKQAEFVRRFKAGQRAREAKGREKRLNRLLKSDAMIDQVQNAKQIHVSMHTDQRAGDRVLNARELTKSFPGKSLWKDIGFEVKRGERIGIIGPNGSGKTTMLRVLIGEEDADGGDIKWGANLNIGYYDQRLDDFDPDATILEEVGRDRLHIKDKQLRDMLATLLFRGDDIFKQMGLLSGGERARVALAELLLDRPNVLLLDEPTNHLDIASCEALEKSLADFEGTILCVSHDRYFLDRMAGRMFVLDPPKMIDFDGGYSAWVRKSHEKKQQAVAVQAPPKPKPKPQPASKPQAAKPKSNPASRPFGRLTMEQLEAEIAKAETAIEKSQSRFADAQQFKEAARAKQLQDEHKSLVAKLEQLEAEYYARET